MMPSVTLSAGVAAQHYMLQARLMHQSRIPCGHGMPAAGFCSAKLLQTKTRSATKQAMQCPQVYVSRNSPQFLNCTMLISILSKCSSGPLLLYTTARSPQAPEPCAATCTHHCKAGSAVLHCDPCMLQMPICRHAQLLRTNRLANNTCMSQVPEPRAAPCAHALPLRCGRLPRLAGQPRPAGTPDGAAASGRAGGRAACAAAGAALAVACLWCSGISVVCIGLVMQLKAAEQEAERRVRRQVRDLQLRDN